MVVNWQIRTKANSRLSTKKRARAKGDAALLAMPKALYALMDSSSQEEFSGKSPKASGLGNFNGEMIRCQKTCLQTR